MKLQAKGIQPADMYFEGRKKITGYIVIQYEEGTKKVAEILKKMQEEGMLNFCSDLGILNFMKIMFISFHHK